MPNAVIDITREVCPMTWVRVKLALEELVVGNVLEVRLRGDEPLRNVPQNVREDGHVVRSLEQNADGAWTLLIEVTS